MDTKTILNEATGRMQKAIDHLEEELLNVRAGKASPNALNGVMVDYFGSQVPVSGAASVTVPDARTILIQPWDKNRRDAVEAFKKAQKEGMPEDESKDGETQSQKLLEKFSKTLDEALSKKEKEIMTV